MKKLDCFKAYDIRGKVPEELDEELCYKIGLAYSHIIKPKTVIVGYDVRLESKELSRALIEGLLIGGSNVINIGLCGTEEVYFHTFNNEPIGVGGGIMVTASHNPKGYNGMKMVSRGSRPISMSGNLKEIRDYVINSEESYPQITGAITRKRQTINEDKTDYILHLTQYINIKKLKKLKIVVNPGNGPAGIIIKLLEKILPFEIIYINEEPDGNFPIGVPNPMIVENRKATSEAVIQNNADLGIAWDGDFDRCFLFDEEGKFIEGYYIVGLLAKSFLKKKQRSKIVHDPRLIWNTIDIAKEYGGIPILSKSGHSFIKEKMRDEDAIYGGEMSAHHYFKDFSYCDSGMIPWLLICELISEGRSLSSLISASMNKFPCSGEINYPAKNAADIMVRVEEHFRKQNPHIDRIDGLSLEFDNWRMNLRSSNTEDLLRLNIETRGESESIRELISEVEKIINANFG